jgi:hypothetical protein
VNTVIRASKARILAETLVANINILLRAKSAREAPNLDLRETNAAEVGSALGSYICITSDLFVSVQRSIHARSPDSLARGD